MRSNYIDETGNIYGKLTVIAPAKDKNNRSAWLCQCECGKSKIVRGPDLRKGKITSCGCGKGKHPNNIRDITNETFGELTAIKYEYSLNKKQYWKFKCSCGKEVIKQKSLVLNGSTRSCGCKTLNLNSIHHSVQVNIGEQFGLQKVIKNLTSPDTLGNTKVLCECILCGRTKEWLLSELKYNPERSCICCNSYKEYQISKILEENNINFQTQYSFKDLLSDNNRRLRFDFALFNEKNKLIGLIEYQGEQHFRLWNYDKDENDLIIRQTYDAKKVSYCQNNNIPLLILDKNSSLTETILNFYNNFND